MYKHACYREFKTHLLCRYTIWKPYKIFRFHSMPVKTNVLILCRFQYFFYRYRVNARPKWYNFVSFSNTIEALLAATTLVKPSSHERHKHKHNINTKSKHDFSSGTCEDKTTIIFLCFLLFCSWLMLGLWSYAYAYDDPYVAGFTSFLCFALMLMLSCEPGLSEQLDRLTQRPPYILYYRHCAYKRGLWFRQWTTARDKQIRSAVKSIHSPYRI